MASILIVDDSPQIAYLLQEMISLLGHTARVATGGREGLAQVHEQKPDLVLLDVMMPEMDGWTFYKRLRQFADIPIIFITASDTVYNRAKALELGEMMLSKDVKLTELCRHIDYALGRKSSVTSSN